MRIAVLSQYGSWSASTRYRAEAHVTRLQKRFDSVDVYLADDQPTRRPGRIGQVRYFAQHGLRYGRRWIDLRRTLPHYDAVFVQRGLYSIGPSWVASVLDQFSGPVVLDLDDDVFSVRPSLENRSAVTKWLYGPHQNRRILHRADAVIVSTPALAHALPEKSDRVRVLPTVPDPANYDVVQHRSDQRMVGWAGTNGGLTYLDPLRPVFETLQQQGDGELLVVSSQPWSGPSRFRAWTLEDEASVFGEMAVGIMPLPDHTYTRAKAGFKLLQYMAAGLPVVASPVGINRELVEESGAGFLARTTDEWLAHLTVLLGDVDLRQRLGSQGRAFVERYADLDGQADVIAELLQAKRA